MMCWARAMLPVVMLALGACAPAPEEVVTTGDPGTTAETTVGTSPVTTTVATTDPTGTTTTVPTGEGDTTTSVDPTSDSGSSGPPAGCMGPGECDSNQACEDGECIEACGGTWGVGSYGYCLTEFGEFDTTDSCGADHTCVYWGDPIEQTACALQDCVDACDCPPPPASGNAVVSCGQITSDGSANDCYLDCDDGQLCPDGMSCNDAGVCVTRVPSLPVYGDCGNLAADCEAPGFCYDAPGGEAACTMSCTLPTDCPNTYPPGGNAQVTCSDIDPATLGFECYLSCVAALSCPDGMTCVNGTLCMWQG